MKCVGKWLSVALLSCVVLAPIPLQAQPPCGGTERWQVKVGTDTGVGNVDLSTQVPITVQQVIHLPQPQRPPQGDNDTRLAEETHVYVVRARLIKFKLETGATGDQDYHLVVSDDTLQFTDERHNLPPGHSFVAEIPSPDCIAGQQGDPSIQSRFIGPIRSARQKLEAQFPNLDGTGNFNDAGGIPVQIVGVGFFDFPHRQVGRALNNIEIHPILDIIFNPGSSSFSISASPSSLSVAQGGNASSTISAAVSGSLTSPISLSISGTPSGTTATFTPVSIDPTGSGTPTLSLAVSAVTQPGNYTLTVTGAAGGETHTASLTLNVQPGDTIPPTATITAPADGATVSGLVNAGATASDNVGVVKLELYIDGTLKACNFNANSIAYPWDTAAMPNGSHTLFSKAYDAAGNVGLSPTVTVTVSN